MSDNQTPSENSERIERVLREYREAMVAADAAERVLLRNRVSELNREFGQRMDEEREASVDGVAQAEVSNDASSPLTYPIASADELTRSPLQVDQTVSLEPDPIDATETLLLESPGHSSGGARAQIGEYEILEEVAKGGMGVVYKARQAKLNRIVALKMIRSGEFADQAQIKRFYVEAEAAAKLDHPGIVPVFDVGETSGQHYYSMAFVDGRSLNECVKDEGPLTPEVAAKTLRDVALAVEHAHTSDVLHRDLKPHNIMLDAKGEPKVTDFGLAKLQQADIEMTATGQVLGTPAYMPPEQAAGRMNEVGVAADVYSLGATLYFALTGRPPFQSANVTDTLRQVIEDEPVAPRQLTPTIPRDLETICLSCLRKETEKRYETAEELADDLQRWLNGEPIVARRVSRAERAWKWCKRKPVIVGSIAAFATLLLVGSLIFWERQNATYARGLVERLSSATPSEVSSIISEVSDYGMWIKDDLQNSFEQSGDPSREKLHAAVGVLAFDDVSLKYLQQKLLTISESEFVYIGVICDALGPHRDATIAFLWQRFDDDSQDSVCRFRAGLALSHLVGESGQWDSNAQSFLAEQLVKTNAVYQSEAWGLLDSVKTRLLKPLEQVFSDSTRTENERLAAANAIAFFADQDDERLARLMLTATGPQYNILFEKYRNVVDESTKANFASAIQQQPSIEMGVEARIALGKKRAASAITLLRLGERESILDVLRYEDDPEALTQFVHRCRPRGVTPSQLIELFEQVDQRRGPLKGEREKIDDRVMYALLLSLGEFSWNELPSDRIQLVARLSEIYELDPSSGVHSATGWLLRRLNQREAVDRVDQTPRSYDPSGHREWYVVEVEYETGGIVGLFTQTEKLYLTFIVFPPTQFTMGSPDYEPNHQADEGQHQVTLTRPIAICDRELTWAQWMAMEGVGRRDYYAGQFSKTLGDRDPVFGVEWFEAVTYCRWLTARAGLSEGHQCYADPEMLPKDDKGNPSKWPLLLSGTGFRLPTEAECEYVCRSGTSGAYSFGHDEQHLDRYAWFQKNSDDWMHATGELRPNPRGLFDIHGNLYEWCHDRFSEGGMRDSTDPTGPDSGRYRISRGGMWLEAARSCRSSYRYRYEPTNGFYGLGFRLAAGLTRQEPEDK